MLSHSLLLTALLSTSPDFATSVTPEQECAPAPLEPERIDAQPFSSTAVDGIQMWGTAATYRLSSGDIGEAFLAIDSAGTGELQLMIHGEIIAHVGIAMDASSNQPVVTTWFPESVSAPPELIAEMLVVDLPVVLSESLPQEFKCSAWGKKVMKAGKYMLVGALGAGIAACCIASQGLACIACGGAGAIGAQAGAEFADGYCD